jgi:presequence protease
MLQSVSGFGVPERITNSWHGLEYYQAIRSLVENIDQNIFSIANKLQALHQHLFGLTKPHLVISSDAKIYEELKQQKFYGLQDLKYKSGLHSWLGKYSIHKMENEGRIIAAPVAFISQVFKTVPYVNRDAAALTVAAGLLENLVLHQRIREQGGAYGGGASVNTLSGTFNFFAYRDPNISVTLQAFADSVKIIGDGNFEDSDLEEAKLEVVQNLDAPVAPGSRAELAYSWMREGKTAEVRQAFRDRLLSLSRNDVIDVIQKQIGAKLGTSSLVVFAGKELLEKAKAETHLVIKTI